MAWTRDEFRGLEDAQSLALTAGSGESASVEHRRPGHV